MDVTHPSAFISLMLPSHKLQSIWQKVGATRRPYTINFWLADTWRDRDRQFPAFRTVALPLSRPIVPDFLVKPDILP